MEDMLCRILERLNTPKAVSIVLAFLLIVSGFLYYRHQLVGVLATTHAGHLRGSG